VCSTRPPPRNCGTTREMKTACRPTRCLIRSSKHMSRKIGLFKRSSRWDTSGPRFCASWRWWIVVSISGGRRRWGSRSHIGHWARIGACRSRTAIEALNRVDDEEGLMTSVHRSSLWVSTVLMSLILWATSLSAGEISPRVNPGGIDSGDTAWMLAASALVLGMIIPGMVFFYGGLVRSKNVIGTMVQAFAILCVVSVVWVICGYSLAFG